MSLYEAVSLYEGERQYPETAMRAKDEALVALRKQHAATVVAHGRLAMPDLTDAVVDRVMAEWGWTEVFDDLERSRAAARSMISDALRVLAESREQ